MVATILALVASVVALSSLSFAIALRLRHILGYSWRWFLLGWAGMAYEWGLILMITGLDLPPHIWSWQARYLLPLGIAACFAFGIRGIARALGSPLVEGTALVAAVVLTPLGIVVAWDPQAQRILGWTAAEILGKDFADACIPPELRARHREGLLRYQQSGPSILVGRRYVTTALHKYGHTFPVEVTVLPVERGGSLQFHGAIIRLHRSAAR